MIASRASPAGSPQAGAGAGPSKSSSASPAPSSSPAVDPAKATSIIRTLIQEYVASRDLGEVRAALDELHAPELMYLVVSQSLTKALQDNKNRVVIAEMCVGMFKAGVLQTGDFERGLVDSLTAVDADFISDEMPLASSFIGDMMAVWVEANCVHTAVLHAAAAHLIECGEAIQIFVHTARKLLELSKGDAAAVRALLETGGVSVFKLIDEDAATAQKEWARIVANKPFMAQIFPSAPAQ